MHNAEHYLRKEERDSLSLMHNAPRGAESAPQQAAATAEATTSRRVLRNPRPPRTGVLVPRQTKKPEEKKTSKAATDKAEAEQERKAESRNTTEPS